MMRYLHVVGPSDARHSKGQEGFTIIEVLIAAIVLIMGSLAVFMTFAAAIHNVQRSKESQVGLSVAQREMEKIRVLPYAKVGLTALPLASSETGNPDKRVVNGTEYNLSRTGTNVKRLVSGGEGAVAPGPEELSSIGGVKVMVYRFVVAEEDKALTESTYCTANPTKAACTASQRKRVVIDVWPLKPAGSPSRRSYYELQSDFFNLAQ